MLGKEKEKKKKNREGLPCGVEPSREKEGVMFRDFQSKVPEGKNSEEAERRKKGALACACLNQSELLRGKKGMLPHALFTFSIGAGVLIQERGGGGGGGGGVSLLNFFRG